MDKIKILEIFTSSFLAFLFAMLVFYMGRKSEYKKRKIIAIKLLQFYIKNLKKFIENEHYEINDFFEFELLNSYVDIYYNNKQLEDSHSKFMKYYFDWKNSSYKIKDLNDEKESKNLKKAIEKAVNDLQEEYKKLTLFNKSC